MAENTHDEQLVRENARREELNRQAKAGRESPDAAERAKWAARDETFTRATRPRDY